MFDCSTCSDDYAIKQYTIEQFTVKHVAGKFAIVDNTGQYNTTKNSSRQHSTAEYITRSNAAREHNTARNVIDTAVNDYGAWVYDKAIDSSSRNSSRQNYSTRNHNITNAAFDNDPRQHNAAIIRNDS